MRILKKNHKEGEGEARAEEEEEAAGGEAAQETFVFYFSTSSLSLSLSHYSLTMYLGSYLFLCPLSPSLPLPVCLGRLLIRNKNRKIYFTICAKIVNF